MSNDGERAIPQEQAVSFEELAVAIGDFAASATPAIAEAVLDYFKQQEQQITQLQEHNRLLTARLEALEEAAMPLPYREQLRQVADQVVTLTDTTVSMARAVEQRRRWWWPW